MLDDSTLVQWKEVATRQVNNGSCMTTKGIRAYSLWWKSSVTSLSAHLKWFFFSGINGNDYCVFTIICAAMNQDHFQMCSHLKTRLYGPSLIPAKDTARACPDGQVIRADELLNTPITPLILSSPPSYSSHPSTRPCPHKPLGPWHVCECLWMSKCLWDWSQNSNIVRTVRK